MGEQKITWLSEEPQVVNICKVVVNGGALDGKTVSVIPVAKGKRAILLVPKLAFGTTWEKRCLGKLAVSRHKAFRMEHAVSEDCEVLTGVSLDVAFVELKVKWEDLLQLGGDEGEHDFRFQDAKDKTVMFPDGEAIVAIAKENFLQDDSTSAEYNTGEEAGNPASTTRLTSVEKEVSSMGATLKNLERMLSGQVSAPPGLPAPATSSGQAPRGSLLGASALAPDVAQDALASGLTAAQLEELKPVLATGARGLPAEVKAPKRKVKLNILGEEDSDGSGGEDVPDPSAGGKATDNSTLTKCLLELTKVTKALAESKVTKQKTKLVRKPSAGQLALGAATALAILLPSCCC